MKTILATTVLAGALLAGAATASQAKGFFYYPRTADATQAYNYNTIAGVAPDFYSTFIKGVRCQYEYRVAYGPHGPERVRVEVCN